MKICKIMLIALLFTLALHVTGTTAGAKVYTAKKVTVTKGKSKTIKTSRKIKKVKISSTNKNFKVKKTANKKFKISGTDVGKTQTVKVTYTNGNTQKFKITTKKKKTTAIPSYAQKIVNELKPLLANPDQGLRTVLNDWLKRLNPRAGYTYEFKLGNWKYGLGATISSLTVEEVMKTYTASQKKALILEVYLRQRMKYSHTKEKESYFYNRNKNSFFKQLYNGTFKGVCDDGAAMVYDICQYLEIKANYVGSHDINHAWTGIWVTNKNGISYWHGIHTVSYAYSMNKSTPVGQNKKINLTEAQVKKYVYSPNAATYFVPLLSKIKTKPATTPTTTPAPTVKPTPTPEQRIVIPASEHNYTCPGCDAPYRHIKPNNPYISNSEVLYKDVTIYEHVVNGVSRYFDANGNEYVDVNHNDYIMDELEIVFG